MAPEALDREVESIVASLLRPAPQAVRSQKRLMREWENLPADRAIAAGIDALVARVRHRRAAAHAVGVPGAQALTGRYWVRRIFTLVTPTLLP